MSSSSSRLLCEEGPEAKASLATGTTGMPLLLGEAQSREELNVWEVLGETRRNDWLGWSRDREVSAEAEGCCCCWIESEGGWVRGLDLGFSRNGIERWKNRFLVAWLYWPRMPCARRCPSATSFPLLILYRSLEISEKCQFFTCTQICKTSLHFWKQIAQFSFKKIRVKNGLKSPDFRFLFSTFRLHIFIPDHRKPVGKLQQDLGVPICAFPLLERWKCEMKRWRRITRSIFPDTFLP